MSAQVKKLDPAKRQQLETEKSNLLEQRSQLLTRADALAEAGESLSQEDTAVLSGLVTDIKNLDDRVSKLEEVLAADAGDDMEENSLKAAELRSQIINDLATLRQPPALSKRAQESFRFRPAGAPNYVRDLGDKQHRKNHDLALRAWALADHPELVTDAHRQAAQAVGLNLNQRSLSLKLFSNPKEELRAVTDPQSVGTAAQGGYLVPTDFVREIEKVMSYINPIRDYAKVIRTNAGNNLDFPVVDESSSTAGTLLAENTAETVKNVTFSKVTLGAYKFSSGLVLSSLEFLQDSGIPVAPLLGELIGDRLARAQGGYFATGTGSSQPQGFVAGSGNGGATASAGAIAVDDLINLVHSLDRYYRTNAAFAMHDTTLKAIRKLKASTTGEPVFQESYRQGEPSTLLGFPVFIDNNMVSATTASGKVVVFGDFSKFVIRDSMDVTILRSDERYFEYGQSAFVGFARTDSKVMTSAALKYLSYS